MDTQCKNKLLACRTYAEAKSILETAGISASGHELAHTAFSIASKQPSLRDQFLGTVIREAEDIEKEDTDKKDELEKKTKETDGGTSNQSSGLADPLPKIGSAQTAPEGADAQPDKKDQMGVSINEMAPMPFQQGMPPPMAGAQAPAMAPPAASPPPPPAPPAQAPPMQKPPAPPQQNMQYIQEAVNYGIRQQVAPHFNKMVEAIKALDKNIQEMSKENVRQLEIGSKVPQHGLGHARLIKETVDDPNMTPDINLGRKRQDMMDYNEGLDSGIYQ